MSDSVQKVDWWAAVRMVRLERGIKQKELASRVGMTQTGISRIENGGSKKSIYRQRIEFELDIRPGDTLQQMLERARAWRIAREAQAAVADAPPAADAARAPDPTPEPAANPAHAEDESFDGARLRIRSKDGPIVPLVLNAAQRHVHERLEDQKAQTGRVRALILKGRQQGCSTYVAARFYRRVTREEGLQVFILTQRKAGTRHLFDIVRRFYRLSPDPPAAAVANSTELGFAGLDSGYVVATAGTQDVGRGTTIQLFHGSEVAYWPYAQSHAAGALQAVPDAPGTEIILESTANGVGNFFHNTWREAEARINDYVPIFIPWYWQDEYRRPVPKDFSLDAEEREYASLYGLNLEQMAWRRAKIAQLRDPRLFKQEFPASAAEAFQMSGPDGYIGAELLARARKAKCEPSGPLIIGYDPAWTGNDRHAMAWRRGRRVVKVETRLKLDTVEAAGWARQVIDAEAPKRFFIDVGGPGCGVCDQLRHLGPPYSKIVEAVNFGNKPIDPPPLDERAQPSGGPYNRRAELWMKSKEWLEEPDGVQIPDSDSLQADACGPRYSYDSLTRLKLEGKEEMRRRGLLSPDEWDAVALTFAEPAMPDRFNRELGIQPRGPV